METESNPEPMLGTESDVVGKRVAAFVLDSFLLQGGVVVVASVVAGIVSALVAVTGADPGALATDLVGSGDPTSLFAIGAAVLGVLAAVATVAYFVVLEWKLGRTPGKMLLGLVVVTEDGDPLSLRAALVRNLLRYVDQVPTFYLLGFVSMYDSDRTQRIGDRVAKTVVVRAGSRSGDGATESRPVEGAVA